VEQLDQCAPRLTTSWAGPFTACCTPRRCSMSTAS
jgi:hypothetical protein